MKIENMILKATEEYAKNLSIQETAKIMNLSSGTVRKMLLTSGVWQNKLSLEIEEIRKTHPEWDSKKIALYL